MIKLLIYYGCHFTANIILLTAFWESKSIHILSMLPIFLVLLMLLQIKLFNSDSSDDNIGDTAYSLNTTRLTKEEQASQYAYLRHSFLICIPFEIPLIFFMTSYWKLLGVIPYLFAYFIGGIMFRIKNGKAVRERINREKTQLEEQIRKEKSGLM